MSTSCPNEISHPKGARMPALCSAPTVFSIRTAILAAGLLLGGALMPLAAEPAPSETEVLLKKAENHYFKRRHYIALRILQRVVEKDPENSRAYSYIGDIYLMRGKLEKAEENLRIAAELSDKKDREFYRLGQVLYMKKDAKGALKAYGQALKHNPRLYTARFQMGLVHFKLLKDKKGTIEHWSAFRKLQPKDPQGPAIDRALALLRNRDYRIPGSKIELPKSTDSRVPYKKADPAKQKVNNKKADVINIDDL